MRDHKPVILDEFNGLWNRGPKDSCPADHFSNCENLQYEEKQFRVRDGIDPYVALGNIIRMYNYVMQEGESLLVLDSNGDIYHVVNPGLVSVVVYGPILSIGEMTDFKMQSIAGRAYITPIQNNTNPYGINYQTGVEDEFVYVYKGDGTAARKAAGAGPTTGALTLADGGAGNVEAGYHNFAVAYETDTGFITKIERFASINVASGGRTVDISNIPVSPDSFVVARRIVATRAIDPTLYTGDTKGYPFFFVPGGRIDNNTDTTLSVSFFDVELFADATYLLDLLEEIPAGATLNTYHGRMVVGAEFDNISLFRVSTAGEPEAIDAVSGLVIIPLDGNPLTNAQEYRDVFYGFKKTRTYSINDNNDVPSSWPVDVVDLGIGASLHGIASVLDSGGVNIEYMLIVDYSGIMVFDGAYRRPELTWKIERNWLRLERNDFANIQIMNDSLGQNLYMTLPDRRMLYGDYRNGLTAKDIKWCPWRFDVQTNTIALIETNKLIIGANGLDEEDA